MPQTRPSLRTLQLGLSGLAGLLDATGFLIANGYFVSFMSGNTTQLGNVFISPHCRMGPQQYLVESG